MNPLPPKHNVNNNATISLHSNVLILSPVIELFFAILILMNLHT